jgi:hypothetical protein
MRWQGCTECPNDYVNLPQRAPILQSWMLPSGILQSTTWYSEPILQYSNTPPQPATSDNPALSDKCATQESLGKYVGAVMIGGHPYGQESAGFDVTSDEMVLQVNVFCSSVIGGVETQFSTGWYWPILWLMTTGLHSITSPSRVE